MIKPGNQIFSRKSRLPGFLFLSLLVLLALSSCVNEEEPGESSISVGDKLPSFSVTLSDGDIISTDSFRGKTGMIVFFNTACPDCREELPVIQNVLEILKNDDNFLLVAIAREESLESVESYWLDNNLSIPFSPQDNRDVYNLFAQSIIPRIFISRPDLTVTYSFDDSDMPDLDQLLQAIDSSR